MSSSIRISFNTKILTSSISCVRIEGFVLQFLHDLVGTRKNEMLLCLVVICHVMPKDTAVQTILRSSFHVEWSGRGGGDQ